MTTRTDYTDLRTEMARPDRDVVVKVGVDRPRLAEAIVQDATYRECQILIAMVTRRQQILREWERDPTFPVKVGIPSFSVKGCTTGRCPCGETDNGQTSEQGVLSTPGEEPVPLEPEPSDDAGPVILPMSLANDRNIDLAT